MANLHSSTTPLRTTVFGRVGDVCAPTRYISTVRRNGQAAPSGILLLLGWFLVVAAALLAGCTAAPTSTIGDDEFVGRPADPPGASDAPPPRHGALWYHLEPDDTRLHVTIRLIDPPSTSTFFLPGPWADRDDFDDRIAIDDAYGSTTESQLPLSIDHSSGRIDVQSDNQEWIELAYRVELHDGVPTGHRFTPFGGDDQFFAYAPTILVVPSAGIAEQIRQIPVEVHSPDDWTVTATWPMAHSNSGVDDQRTTGFVAYDIHTLRDAFIGGGDDWRQLTRHDAHGAIHFTATADFAFDNERLLDQIAELTDYFLARFGIYDQVSVIALPGDTDDGPPPLDGTGRRGGFVLQVPTDHPLDDDLLILTAHEAFHMWNGHRLIPAADAADDTMWFREGLTHYVALKTLARLDLVDHRSLLDELARAGQYYLDNPVIAGGQVRSIDEHRFPYDRGLLIALALDLSLLEHTDGTLTIEDWIGTLLAEPFADDARSYDPALLQESFRVLTRDFDAAVLRRYDELVNTDETIDVAALFETLGLHFIEARNGDDNPRLLPIEDHDQPFETLFRFSNQ